jgi:Asp-tRNA(Asn)/Glu-tRNA(Gln) amidotransferase A subunit family amidase
VTELSELGAAELVSAYAGRETAPLEVVRTLLARIDEHDRRLGSFVTLCGEDALAAAATMTRELSEGTNRGPLHGVPVAVKDIMDVAGIPVTCGTEALPVRTPIVDAVCVARLRAAGAIIVGVTRTHEIAWGLTTQHSRLGGTRNPWGETRIPGGSSGGSAAAVAAQFVPLALGSDTGGSCRLPAAFCGVNGWKPTYGSIPADGILPLAHSLDHVGLIGRSVEDIALGDAVLRQTGCPYRH